MFRILFNMYLFQNLIFNKHSKNYTHTIKYKNIVIIFVKAKEKKNLKKYE